MSNIVIEAVPDCPEATVLRRIDEGHPLHDGRPGAVIETYRLPDNLPGSIYVRNNRGAPERKALIHLAVDGDPTFYLVAEPANLERTIADHSLTQEEKLPAVDPQVRELQPAGMPAACPINPLDEECDACQ